MSLRALKIGNCYKTRDGLRLVKITDEANSPGWVRGVYYSEAGDALSGSSTWFIDGTWQLNHKSPYDLVEEVDAKSCNL